LFDALLKINQEKMLDVGGLERASVLPGAVYARDLVPCDGKRPAERREWLAGLKAKLKGCNFLFVDPDNGIASERLKLTHRRAGKSVAIEEITELKRDARTIVVYHHQTRFAGGHQSEIRHLANRLAGAGLKVSGALRAKPWVARAFFILNGGIETRDRAERIAECWKGKISWHPEAEILKYPKRSSKSRPSGVLDTRSVVH
jgi:hypothetical protein